MASWPSTTNRRLTFAPARWSPWRRCCVGGACSSVRSPRPALFIPIAEECGAIVPIGEWVIRQACKQIKEFGLAGFGHVIRIAVNAPVAQFARPDFVRYGKNRDREGGRD